MKKLLASTALVGALLASSGAMAIESKSPIFGKAATSLTSIDQNKSTVGKGYYADYYGYYGYLYSYYAYYYAYYGYAYSNTNYYYYAYSYSSSATNYLYYAYYYSYYGI